jgi:sulfite reductase (NADPH) flavoprotein alpha-component
VIAVVGFTGGLLSYEDEIKHALNPGLLSVEPRATAPLSPAELVARIEEARPGKRVGSLTLFSEPGESVRMSFASPPQESGAPRRRPETHYVSPYTGELLAGEVRGQDFFHVVEDLHRRLAGGDTGKQIVGACTVVLILMAVSGLYLRWPRGRARDWRAWLGYDFSLRGGGLWWNLHAVTGTWVLAFYLLAGLSGLFWSYDWYRSALYGLTGVERPDFQRGGGNGPPGARGAEQRRNAGAGSEEIPRADLAAVWAAFTREAGAYSSVMLRLPERPGQAMTVSYLDADPPHGRAFNRMQVDAATGAVKQHERYRDKTPAAKAMGSMFPLHSGEFFGAFGRLLMMVASLLMPLFALTGWLLYLDRRRQKRKVRLPHSAGAARPVPQSPDSTGRL